MAFWSSFFSGKNDVGRWRKMRMKKAETTTGSTEGVAAGPDEYSWKVE
jgi:hypothetical protein